MLCLPEEMVERLDRYPDAAAQVYEVRRWYTGMALRREDQRILDLNRRGFAGKDQSALDELEELLLPRAERNDTSVEEERRKVVAKYDRKPSRSTDGDSGSDSPGSFGRRRRDAGHPATGP